MLLIQDPPNAPKVSQEVKVGDAEHLGEEGGVTGGEGQLAPSHPSLDEGSSVLGQVDCLTQPIRRLFHSPIVDLRPDPGAPEVGHRNLGVLLVEQLLSPSVPVVLQQSLRASAKLGLLVNQPPSTHAISITSVIKKY